MEKTILLIFAIVLVSTVAAQTLQPKLIVMIQMDTSGSMEYDGLDSSEMNQQMMEMNLAMLELQQKMQN